MQKRTSPLKFGDLAEKSGLNSVLNLSTKARTGDERLPPRAGRDGASRSGEPQAALQQAELHARQGAEGLGEVFRR